MVLANPSHGIMALWHYSIKHVRIVACATLYNFYFVYIVGCTRLGFITKVLEEGEARKRHR